MSCAAQGALFFGGLVLAGAAFAVTWIYGYRAGAEAARSRLPAELDGEAVNAALGRSLLRRQRRIDEARRER